MKIEDSARETAGRGSDSCRCHAARVRIHPSGHSDFAARSLLTRSQRAAGFTLFELLLVTVIFFLFLTAIVINFSNLGQSTELEDGASRLESMLRFARAEASRTGRNLRLELVAGREPAGAVPLYGIDLSVESDPIGAPGVYSELRGAEWARQGVGELIGIESLRPIPQLGEWARAAGADGDEPEDPEDPEGVSSEEDADSASASLTFFPDGSSDSVEIVVRSRRPQAMRRISIRLIGITGTFTRAEFEEDTLGSHEGEKRL